MRRAAAVLAVTLAGVAASIHGCAAVGVDDPLGRLAAGREERAREAREPRAGMDARLVSPAGEVRTLRFDTGEARLRRVGEGARLTIEVLGHDLEDGPGPIRLRRYRIEVGASLPRVPGQGAPVAATAGGAWARVIGPGFAGDRVPAEVTADRAGALAYGDIRIRLGEAGAVLEGAWAARVGGER